MQFLSSYTILKFNRNAKINIICKKVKNELNVKISKPQNCSLAVSLTLQPGLVLIVSFINTLHARGNENDKISLKKLQKYTNDAL